MVEKFHVSVGLVQKRAIRTKRGTLCSSAPDFSIPFGPLVPRLFHFLLIAHKTMGTIIADSTGCLSGN